MSTQAEEASNGGPSGYYAWTDTLRAVYYGPGCLAASLPKLQTTLKVKKALVVTGRSLNDKTDVVRRVEEVLKAHGAYGATFCEIGQHTPIAGIRNGLQAYKDNGCDHIVAIGGGSPIDGSKAILYHVQRADGGVTPPQIAIPTTLSAAEYTIGAGYTDDTGNKVAVSSQELAPAGVILDAELTCPTPERLWLSTGIRALDHAVENLYRPFVAIPSKALCYAAIKDLFEYLPQSKREPDNVAVRQRLQVASWMSLWPMNLESYSALGISHSLGHKLGARYSIPHGITSCLTLAPTVDMKAEVGSEEDQKCLAEALFYLKEPSTGSLGGDVRRLAAMINELISELGLTTTLDAYHVPKEDLASIAEGALRTQSQSYETERVVQLLQSLYAS